MNSLSWTSLFLALLTHGIKTVSGADVDEPNDIVLLSASPSATSSDTSLPTSAAVTSTHSHTDHTAAIVGGVLGGIGLILLILLFVLLQGRQKVSSNLEDGMKSEPSGRDWFSRFHRFRRDTPVSAPTAMWNEKASAIPHHLRSAPLLGGQTAHTPRRSRRSPAPRVSRSSHMITTLTRINGSSPIMVSLPATPQTTRVSDVPSVADSLQSLDRSSRRKVQVAASHQILSQPFARTTSQNVNLIDQHGSPWSRSFRNPFRFKNSKILPPAPAALTYEESKKHPSFDEILVEKQEKELAVASLEMQSRKHRRRAHSVTSNGSIGSSRSSTASCGVDERFEKEIHGLKQEVKFLNALLPESEVSQNPPEYKA